MTQRTARVTYSKRQPPSPAVRNREAIERESMTKFEELEFIEEPVDEETGKLVGLEEELIYGSWMKIPVYWFEKYINEENSND